MLYCLSANVGSVVEKATAMANQANGDLGNGWLKTHTAGAGAYKLTAWAASDHVIIDANPHADEKPRCEADRAAARRKILGHSSCCCRRATSISRATCRLRPAEVARRHNRT